MTIPKEILDMAGLDAQMRATAEMSASGTLQQLAQPTPSIDPAETAEEGTPQIDAAEKSVDALDVPGVLPPITYQARAPFGLVFSFNPSTGAYAGVTMDEPTFWWNEEGTLTEKTATIGTLTLSGTVYLNVTLDANGKYSSSAVAMSASGDLSIKLYQLDVSGIVKDYRHALVALGVGMLPLDGNSLDVNASGSQRNIQIKGFAAANQGLAPYKNANGQLVWGGKIVTNASVQNNTLTLTFADGSTPVVLTVNDGQDGVSPAVTVTEKYESNVLVGHTVTITDANHGAQNPLTFDVLNGRDGQDGTDGRDGTNGTNGTDGQDGYSPTATVTKSGRVATITITDKNGTTTETIADGTDATVTTSTTPSDCVLSTGSAAVGSSTDAARADHVHKLPSTVVDTSQLKNLSLDSTTLGKIVASQNATIQQKTIAAGDGISVSTNGNTITISLAQGAGSLFSGNKTVVKSVSYNTDTGVVTAEKEVWTFAASVLVGVTAETSDTIATTPHST